MSPLDEALLAGWHPAATAAVTILLAMTLSLAVYGLWTLRR